MNKGSLVVISGFSGAGKGTLMKSLTTKYDDYALSVSATTRAPREGEKEGVNYFYKTVEEFEKLISDNMLIEYAKYVDNYYGTPRAFVEDQMALGKNVLLEIEIQGAQKIKEMYPEALFIFVTTKDADTLHDRLVGRNTEDEATITKRLSRAVEESMGVELYDYIVVNDELDECVETIDKIVRLNNNRTCCKIGLINNIREELKAYV